MNTGSPQQDVVFSDSDNVCETLGLDSLKQMELLNALRKLKDTHLIFTMPNADTDGRVIFKMIENFVINNSKLVLFSFNLTVL